MATSVRISNSSSSSSSRATSLASQLEALEGVKIHPFTEITNLQEIVDAQIEELQSWESDQQFVIFDHVTEAVLDEIDHEREHGRVAKCTRMTHYTDTNLLIIKLMPSVPHEEAHLCLAGELPLRAQAMGVHKRELRPVGASRFRGNSSSKEGDSAYKPRSTRIRNTYWPTIVFEAGLSESLGQLRLDANWWLRNSEGDVKIVVIISLQKALSRVSIEKWELTPSNPARPRTRANQETPTRVQEITINPNNVTGAPLVLDFQKIFLRPATTPETNFIFTAQELSTFATDIWAGL
jgi:hypothetical protein